jgi:ABC-2 type transport system permease protein
MAANAFLYLTTRSFLNRLRVRFRRLREPRYLVGLVAGLLYMWTFVFRNLFRTPSPGRSGGVGALTAMMQGAGPIIALGAVFLFIFTALNWLWPGRKPALTFSRAEVQFLFQAPLTRRQLVHYRLVRSQVGTILSSVITTLLLRPGSLAMGWTTTVGLWLMFSIMSLHTIGLSLSQQSVRRAGLIGLAKQWLPITLLVGSIAVLVGTLAVDWSHLASLGTPREVVAECQRLATSGPAGIVLWPFRAVLRVPLSGNAHDFLLALPLALLILAINYVWVLQADAKFEEASAARSEQVAERLAAIRSGRM